MSKTSFGKMDQLTQMKWGRGVLIEAERSSLVGKFIGSDPERHIIVKYDDLEKGQGDTLRTALLHTLDDTAVRGDSLLSGKGCKLEFSFEDICIDVTRKAVNWETLMSGQRTPYNLRKLARSQLKNWGARLIDRTFFNHLAGYSPANGNPFLDGNNDICEPSDERICLPNGHECEDDVNTDPTAVMTLDRISGAVALAKNLNGKDEETFRPIQMEGGEYFILFISDEDRLNLRRDPCWKEVQQFALAGGDIRNNPLFTGAIGMWDNVLIYDTNRLPNGVAKDDCKPLPNVRRSVLVGAGAMSMAYGGIEGAKGLWTEEVSDHTKCREVGYTKIWGMKKNRYAPQDACPRGQKFIEEQCQDYATLVLPSYVNGFKSEKPADGGTV